MSNNSNGMQKIFRSFFLIATVAFLSVATVSFAAWTAPSATPPNGNTEPPINVGTIGQIKQGMIGAREFCLYDNGGTQLSCLGKDVDNFPFIFDGATENIKNTNTGNVNIGGGDSAFNTKKVNVNGGVKATEFCIGTVCLNNLDFTVVDKFPATCTSGYYLKYDGSKYVCAAVSGVTGVTGIAPKTTNNLTKWQNGAGNVITDSILSEIIENSITKLVLGGEKITKWSDITKNFGVSSIIAGNNIEISPATGKGDVTVSYKPDLPTGVKCAAGQILKWSGTVWACAPDNNNVLSLSCLTAGQILKWDDVNTEWTCAADNTIGGLTGAANAIPKFNSTGNGLETSVMSQVATTYNVYKKQGGSVCSSAIKTPKCTCDVSQTNMLGDYNCVDGMSADGTNDMGATCYDTWDSSNYSCNYYYQAYTKTPIATPHVAIKDGTQAAGKILSSIDTNGTSIWKTAAELGLETSGSSGCTPNQYRLWDGTSWTCTEKSPLTVGSTSAFNVPALGMSGSQAVTYTENGSQKSKQVVTTPLVNSPISVTPDAKKVGIGTANPTTLLEIVGGVTKTTGGLIIETRTAAQGNPTAPATGQIWLMTQ